jgi:hypothetical protein
MTTFDRRGYFEAGVVYFQLKATDHITAHVSNPAFVFQLSVEDYNLWMIEPFPVYLILYCSQTHTGYWLYVQNYFEQNPSRCPKLGKKSVRVQIPKINVLRAQTILEFQAKRDLILGQLQGVVTHD